MRRFVPVIALSLAAGCKTATEKQCDATFDRYERCTGKEIPRALRAAADEYCYIALGHELQPGDTTSYYATARRTILECGAITACAPLEACFAKHTCTWTFTGPEDTTPSFSCRD